MPKRWRRLRIHIDRGSAILVVLLSGTTIDAWVYHPEHAIADGAAGRVYQVLALAEDARLGPSCGGNILPWTDGPTPYGILALGAALAEWLPSNDRQT